MRLCRASQTGCRGGGGNALTREALVREKERLHMLLEVKQHAGHERDLQKLFPVISGFMRRNDPL